MQKLLKSMTVAARLFLVVAFLLPNAAVAASTPAPTPPVIVKTQGDLLLNEGLALYDAGKWQEALAKFEAAQASYAAIRWLQRESSSLQYIGHTKSELGDLTGAVAA